MCACAHEIGNAVWQLFVGEVMNNLKGVWKKNNSILALNVLEYLPVASLVQVWVELSSEFQVWMNLEDAIVANAAMAVFVTNSIRFLEEIKFYPIVNKKAYQDTMSDMQESWTAVVQATTVGNKKQTAMRGVLKWIDKVRNDFISVTCRFSCRKKIFQHRYGNL